MCILYFFGQNSDFYTTVMTRLVSLPHESLPLHHRYVTPGGDPEWNLNERRHTHFNLTAGGCVCVCDEFLRLWQITCAQASGGIRKGTKRSANHFTWSLGGTFGVWLCYQLIKAENENERDCFNPVMDVAVRQIVRNNKRRWRRENTFKILIKTNKVVNIHRLREDICNVFMVISKKMNLILSVCLSAGRRQISRLITEDKIPQRAGES